MSRTKRVAKGLATYGWPDVMRTSIAAGYIGSSRWTVLRAVHSGDLVPAGKRGRSFTFTKASLDEYLLGEPTHLAETANGGTNTPSKRTSGDCADALARLAVIKRDPR